jgi:hypothetical protein
MTIRESVIYFQKKLKISSVTLCKACDIDKTAYSAFINNKRNLPYKKLQRILDYMNLNISD